MLTHSSDSLPQIVCPMDEDAIPSNPFYSAPPHSEPPPPLLPLSSVTPSCANDESGHERSGHIQRVRAQTPTKQCHKDIRAVQKPSRHNLSPTRRQRKSRSMVQVSQSKHPKVVSEAQNKDGLDFTVATETQNTEKDQKSTWNEPDVSAEGNIVEQVADEPTAESDNMDTCRDLAVEHCDESASSLKGWVIGPLFRNFKSKISSFTDIVWSPVKLFRPASPPLSMDDSEEPAECQLQDDGPSDVELSNTEKFQPVGQTAVENQEADVNQQRVSDDAKDGAQSFSKKLVFDVDLSTNNSEQIDECAVTPTKTISPESVPSEDTPKPVSNQVSQCVGSSLQLKPSVILSISQESDVKMSSAGEKQGRRAVRLKPLPRKGTGNRSESKKATSKPHIKTEKSDPQFSEQQLSQRTSNKSDPSNTDKTWPLSASAFYTHLGADNLQPDDENKIKNIKSDRIVGQSLCNNSNKSPTARRTLKSSLDTEKLENQTIPDSYSTASHGRSKRGIKGSLNSQESGRRKKLRVDGCKEDVVNLPSDSGKLRVLRPQRKEVVLTDIIVDGEETLKPLIKSLDVATRTNRKGKLRREILPTVNEAMLNALTECSPDEVMLRSVDKSGGASENSQKGSGTKTKPVGSGKRLKTRSDVCKPDSMDLETTMAITSSGQTQQEPLSEVLVHPVKKRLHSTSKSRAINKKPVKRKSPVQMSLMTEIDSTLSSNSLVQSIELTSTTFDNSPPVQREENLKRELNQPSKRSKRGLKGAVTSGVEVTTQCTDNNLCLITKECQSKEGKGKKSMDPVYFEMTPFESQQSAPSPSRSNSECCVQLNNEVKHLLDEMINTSAPFASVANEPVPVEASNTSRLRSSARRSNTTTKPRRVDKQRRRCRALLSRTNKGEEMSVTMEDADLTPHSSENLSNRLLRSYSCPEIPSFQPQDTPWTSSLHSPHHSRTPTSQQHQSFHTPFVPQVQKFIRRARRHTVCSVEVEREIAPLCLRKEVYPLRRSLPHDGFTQHLSPRGALSPSTFLAALASRFLSSPLVFLSNKVDGRRASASPSTSSPVFSPVSPSSLTSSVNSSSWHHSGILQSSDSSHSPSNSTTSGRIVECETEMRQSEEEEDAEDTSSSSQEYEDIALKEEKALSDSEIKVVQKQEQRGKVSSIRIRKTLPKPQNNLTPMGLPKAIRLKKKEFSLEEIYTNKNFSKPPESRLETIFEVPLSRRNGSESWFGQRRVKRFLEFVEVGEARKPKKPLVGVGKMGTSSSRTRRGGMTKEEPSLGVQDVDSLLCAKLDQLSLLLIHDQKDS